MERLLIVVKRTKWERDLVRYGSARTAKKVYARQNHAYDRVHDSHKRQISALDRIKKELPAARFLYREELPFVDPADFDLVVSFGGDNHFVYVSHFAEGRPLLGLNSDPDSSTGALLYFNPEEFLQQIPRASDPQALELETWSRIRCSIDYPDGRILDAGCCTSEISVRSGFHDYISRYLITKEGDEWEEQKSSGLLLACGAGSTGWYRNCHPAEQHDSIVFPKDADFFRGVARETSSRARKRKRYLAPTVRRGETLLVVSEMDGEVTIDAEPDRTFDFPPGARASFRLDGEPLRVVRRIR